VELEGVCSVGDIGDVNSGVNVYGFERECDRRRRGEVKMRQR